MLSNSTSRLAFASLGIAWAAPVSGAEGAGGDSAQEIKSGVVDPASDSSAAEGDKSAEKKAAERRKEWRQRAEPIVAALELSETRRESLLEEVGNLYARQQDGSIWPEAYRENWQENGLPLILSVLGEHGFLEEDLRAFEQLPDEASGDLRASVALLHARQLLREGPANLENQWPKWDQGDTPGSAVEYELQASDLPDEAGGGLRSLLTKVAPQNPVYADLQQRFVEIENNLETLKEEFREMPEIQEGEVVRAGQEYAGAELLRKRLVEEGFLKENAQDDNSSGDQTSDSGTSSSDEGTAGVYTEKMSEAVKSFQDYYGRSVDGILGPNTLAELNRSPEENRETLRINLHRARLLPDGLGDRAVVVNIPSARVFAFEGDAEPTVNMKVIIGESNRSHQTPVLRDVMETVEFGPYWNVPTGIASSEIVPKARNDHGYLARNNYEIVDEFGTTGSEPVTSRTLSLVEQGAMFIRQRPGPENALGAVKFLFRNDYAIYLHDTPADHLFSENQRDFSHGCIRLERPADFAAWVLNPRDWDSERTSRMMQNGVQETLSIREPVNVYIVYLTAFPAWENADRAVKFHPDLYERDGDLEELVGTKSSES